MTTDDVSKLGRVMLMQDVRRLEEARIELAITYRQLWIDYFALGGNHNADDIEAWLTGHEPLTAREHDLLALALNERYTDLGHNHPLPYTDAHT